MSEEEAPPDRADEAGELLREYVDSSGATLRAESGVLRGVKLLGLRSRNGRRYAEGALRRAVGLYEGAKVNVNHPARDPLSPRDYRDRLGVVRNVRLESGAGLFGDLHYNPKHALAEQLAWDAQHAPQNVGLSHNVLAKTRREAGETVVEAITRVQSVDLVADPATTAGLFEQTDPETATLTEQNAQLRERLDQAQQQLTRLAHRARIEELLREHGVAAGDPAQAGEAFLRLLMEADEAELPALVEEHAALLRRGAALRPASREQRPLGERREFELPDSAAFVEAISLPRR